MMRRLILVFLFSLLVSLPSRAFADDLADEQLLSELEMDIDDVTGIESFDEFLDYEDGHCGTADADPAEACDLSELERLHLEKVCKVESLKGQTRCLNSHITRLGSCFSAYQACLDDCRGSLYAYPIYIVCKYNCGAPYYTCKNNSKAGLQACKEIVATKYQECLKAIE